MHEYTRSNGYRKIAVTKVGGGTVGKKYDGDWEVTVTDGGTVVLDDVITTNMPKHYYEIADLADEFAGDSLEV